MKTNAKFSKAIEPLIREIKDELKTGITDKNRPKVQGLCNEVYNISIIYDVKMDKTPMELAKA